MAHPRQPVPDSASRDSFFGRFFSIFCCCGDDSSNTARKDNGGDVYARQSTVASSGAGSRAGYSVNRQSYSGGTRRASTNARDSTSLELRDSEKDSAAKRSEDDEEHTTEKSTINQPSPEFHEKKAEQYSPEHRSKNRTRPASWSSSVDDALLAAARDATCSFAPQRTASRESLEDLKDDGSLASPDISIQDSLEKERKSIDSADLVMHGVAGTHKTDDIAATSAAVAAISNSIDKKSDRDESPAPLTHTTTNRSEYLTMLSQEEQSIIARGRVEVYHPLQHDQVTEFGPAFPTDASIKAPTSLLAPARDDLIDRKCLVLDLDETLVHSSFKYLPQADFVIPVEIEGQYHNVYVIKRPGVDDFLKRVGDLYEIVVFTASVSKV